MDSLLQDLRFSLRQFASRPGFALVVVAVLAIAIGAATAIFSVFDTLVLRALPYEGADRIVTLWEHGPDRGSERDEVAPGNFYDWRDAARSFEVLAAFDPYSLDLTGEGRPEVVFAARVTRGFFDAFGTRMLLGRGFVPEDFDIGGAVVIGERLWERRFGSDPELVGRSIVLDGVPTTVVGIAPRSFNPHFQPTVTERDAWIPLVEQGWERQMRGSRFWNVVGRLAPGVTLEAARAEMAAVSARLAVDHPQSNAGMRASVVPLRDHLVGDARTALLVLQGAVLFLLLVGCANVASLMLARGTEREGELSLRAALGAGRGRLVRQLLTESVAIAVLGGAAGVLVAYGGLDLIVAIGPPEIARLDEVAVDGRVLGFALGASLMTALAFGLVPSIHFSRPDLRVAMKEGRRGASGTLRSRIRGGLVVAEIALSLMLVVGAGLLARSFVELLRVDPGFDGERVAALQVFHYPEGETPGERAAFFDEVLERIRGLPGVVSAGAVSALPFIEADVAIRRSFVVEDRPDPRPEDRPTAFVAQATVDYFETMGIPVIEGRAFGARDRDGSVRVTVVGQGLARRYWPGESPIGERLAIDGYRDADGRAVSWEVIGVVGQVRHEGLDRDPRPELFLSEAQAPSGGMVFVARTRTAPRPSLERMQTELWTVDPDQPVYRAATLQELLARSVAGRRFTLWILATFAAIGLVLAVVGIYGVVAYATRLRTHEFGVRMALGAGRADIMGEVMRRGFGLAGTGILIGLAGSLGLTGLMARLLYGVGPRDPLTLLVVATVLMAVALLATWLPARRATSVDPSCALRIE